MGNSRTCFCCVLLIVIIVLLNGCATTPILWKKERYTVSYKVQGQVVQLFIKLTDEDTNNKTFNYIGCIKYEIDHEDFKIECYTSSNFFQNSKSTEYNTLESIDYPSQLPVPIPPKGNYIFKKSSTKKDLISDIKDEFNRRYNGFYRHETKSSGIIARTFSKDDEISKKLRLTNLWLTTNANAQYLQHRSMPQNVLSLDDSICSGSLPHIDIDDLQKEKEINLENIRWYVFHHKKEININEDISSRFFTITPLAWLDESNNISDTIIIRNGENNTEPKYYAGLLLEIGYSSYKKKIVKLNLNIFKYFRSVVGYPHGIGSNSGLRYNHGKWYKHITKYCDNYFTDNFDITDMESTIPKDMPDKLTFEFTYRGTWHAYKYCLPIRVILTPITYLIDCILFPYTVYRAFQDFNIGGH